MKDVIKDKKVIQKVQIVPTDTVIPYEGNIKQHTLARVKRLAQSLMMYGWDQPIVVDKEMIVIKGHGRLMAAKDLGLETVPIVINTALTDEEVRISRIADNKAAESDWDIDLLWEELMEAKRNGISHNEMGFDSGDIRKLFPAFDWAFFGVKKTEYAKKKEEFNEETAHDDPTRPQVEGFITPFEGKDAFLRKLSMVDYLNYHDKILVGFSGGKDSLAALVWTLENCDREKVVPYFSNLAWGVDWPHGIVFVQLLEKMYDCKIYICGSSDPAAPMRFEDLLLQFGYMESYSCWYRNNVKIRNIRAFVTQEKLLPKYGVNPVKIIGVRWAESKDRAMTYPDRGFIKDDGMDYASPLIQWTDADIIAYLQERGIMLHTAYQHSNRMGCIVCPNSDRKDCINTRKKFPRLYQQIMEWHGKGARRKRRLQKVHFCRMIASIVDLTDTELQLFKGVYGDISLSSSEFEDYVEEKMGIKLAVRPYVTIPFDAKVHNFRNDLKSGSLEDPTLYQKDTFCTLDA